MYLNSLWADRQIDKFVLDDSVDILKIKAERERERERRREREKKMREEEQEIWKECE